MALHKKTPPELLLERGDAHFVGKGYTLEDVVKDMGTTTLDDIIETRGDEAAVSWAVARWGTSGKVIIRPERELLDHLARQDVSARRLADEPAANKQCAYVDLSHWPISVLGERVDGFFMMLERSRDGEREFSCVILRGVSLRRDHGVGQVMIYSLRKGENVLASVAGADEGTKALIGIVVNLLAISSHRAKGLVSWRDEKPDPPPAKGRRRWLRKGWSQLPRTVIALSDEVLVRPFAPITAPAADRVEEVEERPQRTHPEVMTDLDADVPKDLRRLGIVEKFVPALHHELAADPRIGSSIDVYRKIAGGRSGTYSDIRMTATLGWCAAQWLRHGRITLRLDSAVMDTLMAAQLPEQVLSKLPPMPYGGFYVAAPEGSNFQVHHDETGAHRWEGAYIVRDQLYALGNEPLRFGQEPRDIEDVEVVEFLTICLIGEDRRRSRSWVRDDAIRYFLFKQGREVFPAHWLVNEGWKADAKIAGALLMLLYLMSSRDLFTEVKCVPPKISTGGRKRAAIRQETDAAYRVIRLHQPEAVGASRRTGTRGRYTSWRLIAGRPRRYWYRNPPDGSEVVATKVDDKGIERHCVVKDIECYWARRGWAGEQSREVLVKE